MVLIAAMTVMRAIRRNKVSPGDHRVAMAGLGNVSLATCEAQLAQWFAKNNVSIPPGTSQSGLDMKKQDVLAGLDTLFRFSAPQSRPVDGFLVLFCGSGDSNGDWVMAQNHTVTLSDVLQVWDTVREEQTSERPQFLYIVSDADHSGQWSQLAWENSYLNVMIQASCDANDTAQPVGVFLSSWLKVHTGELWLDQANSALEAFGTSAKPYVAPGCRTPLLDTSGAESIEVSMMQRIITLGNGRPHEDMEELTQRHIEYLQMVQRQAAKGNEDMTSTVKPWTPPSQYGHQSDEQGPKLEWLEQSMRLLKLHLWDPAVVVEALRALWSLAYHEKIRQAFDAAWISVVLAAMENHLPDLDLLISAAGVLSRLAWNPWLVKSMREQDRCAKALKNILRLHRSDIMLCRMCCVLMYSIAENDATSTNGSGLRDLCLAPLLSALELHIHCPVTTSAAMSALLAMHPAKPDLMTSPEEIGQAESIVRSVVAFAAVMNAHPDNTDVHRQASLALSRITASPEGCRLLAEAHSGNEAIGHLISALGTSVSRFDLFGYEVAWQCCLCLRGMAQNSHLKWAIVSHENYKTIHSCVVRFTQAVQTPDWLVGVSKALLDIFDEFSFRRGME